MDYVTFKNRNALRAYLSVHALDAHGIWIRFDKSKVFSQLTASEALDEALCFGWIDSTIKKIDDTFYLKYFSKRRQKSIWSTKNKKRVQTLIDDGLMTSYGLEMIRSAKDDGRWEKSDSVPTDFSLESFSTLILPYKNAYLNFENMSKSVQKTYAMRYFCLKKQGSRDKRLLEILDKLEKNLKPM